MTMGDTRATLGWGTGRRTVERTRGKDVELRKLHPGGKAPPLLGHRAPSPSQENNPKGEQAQDRCCGSLGCTGICHTVTVRKATAMTGRFCSQVHEGTGCECSPGWGGDGRLTHGQWHHMAPRGTRQLSKQGAQPRASLCTQCGGKGVRSRCQAHSWQRVC